MLQNISNTNAKELLQSRAIRITKFWEKYGYYQISPERLSWAIGEHLKYDTIETVEVKGEIVAFGRWNITGNKAIILDCVIRPDYRKKNLTRYMLLKAWKRFPYVEYIEFKRGLRNEKPRRLAMKRFVLGIK